MTHLDLVCLPQGWIQYDRSVEGHLVFAKMSFDKHFLSATTSILIRVDKELRWSISCHGSLVDVAQSRLLSSVLPRLTSTCIVNNLFSVLQNVTICQGNRAEEFQQLVDAHGELFMESTGGYVA